MNTATPVDAHSIIQKGEALVIDVRTPAEFAEGHLAGAWNFDIHDATFMERLKGLEHTAQYVVYCQSGGRSSRAVSIMHELGFRSAVDMMGGITAWKKAGFPVEK